MPEGQTKTKKESYLIEGMSCAGCERSIQKVIGNLSGVTSAHADLGSASMEVEYDPSVVNIDDIKTAVSKLGYKIIGTRPPLGQKERRDDSVS